MRCLFAITLALALVPPLGSAAFAAASLEKIQALALAYSPAIRGARARLGAARGRLTVAKSPMLPQISGEGEASIYRSHKNGESGQRSLGLTWRQTVLDLTIGPGAKAAEMDLAQLRQDLAATRQEIILAVRKAFFSVLEAEALLKVAQGNLAITGRHLERIRAYRRQGLKSLIDLVRAKRDVARAKLTLIQERHRVRRARVTLARTVGLPGVSRLALTAPATPKNTAALPRLVRLLALAQAGRPEVLALRAAINAAANRLSAAKSGRWPQVTASGGLGLSGTHNPGYEAWDFGLYLTAPIYTGGRIKGQTAERAALLRAAKAELALMRDLVRSQVETALLLVSEAAEEVRAGQAVVALEKENLHLAEARYRVNLATPLELSEATQNLARGQSELVSARFRLLTALAELDFGVAGALAPFGPMGEAK